MHLASLAQSDRLQTRDLRKVETATIPDQRFTTSCCIASGKQIRKLKTEYIISQERDLKWLRKT